MPLKDWCESCHVGMSRMYVRIFDKRAYYSYDYNGKKKKYIFKPIGWFCLECRILQLDPIDETDVRVRRWKNEGHEAPLFKNIIEQIQGASYRWRYRVYFRSRNEEEGRGFIPLAYYYRDSEFFELDLTELRGRNMEVKLMLESMSPEMRAMFEKPPEEIIQEAAQDKEAELEEIAIKLLESKGYVVSKPSQVEVINSPE